MQCPRCGILASVKAERCPACGLRFHVHVPAPVVEGQPVAPAAVQYAGFWRRLTAFSIDSILLSALSGAVFEILRIIYRLNYGNPKVPNNWSILLSFMSTAVFFIVLPAILESSRYQSTPGKMLSGIVVTDTQGKRTSFRRALLRNILKVFLLASLAAASVFLWGMFNIGVILKVLIFTFLLILILGMKRQVHDIMTGCLVVVKEPKQVAPVTYATQPVQQTQTTQSVPEVAALPVEPNNKTPETQPTDKNWLYL